MKNQYHYLGLILLFCCSCTADLDIDPQKQSVVVHGVLVNEPRQVIDLHYTSYLSGEYMPPIEQAKVWVEQEDLDGTVLHQYEYVAVGNGRWEAEFTPEFGAKYNLLIQVPGRPVIQATTIFPSNKNMRNLRCNAKYYNFETAYIPLYLWVYGQDYNPNTRSYALTSLIYGEGQIRIYEDPESFFLEVDDPDTLLDCEGFLDDFNEAVFQVQDIPELRLSYAYYKSPTSMLRKRYLRFELGTSKDPQLYFEYPLTLIVLPVFQLSEDLLPHPNSYVVFESVSEEYDLYLRYVLNFEERKEVLEESRDYIQLYNHTDSYTNLEHAIGIFGASYKLKLATPSEYYNYQKDKTL